jgi:hypothetical protein
LEEAILPMQEAKGAGDISASGPMDCRHPERVAVDDYRGAKSGQTTGAVKLRKARAKLQVEPGGDDKQESTHDTCKYP